MNVNGNVKIISYRRAVALLVLHHAVNLLPLLVALVIVVAGALTGTPGISLGAAVTVVRNRRTVFGHNKVRMAEISGGNSDTFDTRMRKVEQVAVTPKTNAPTAFAESTVNGYITLTLTTGGAFTNVKIIVFGF